MRWGEFLDGGYSNFNFRLRYQGRECVLRVPPPQRTIAADASVLPEALLMATVAACNAGPNLLSSPAILAYNATQGAQVSEWAPAPLLAESAPVAPERLGHMLATFHARLAPLRDLLVEHDRSDAGLARLLERAGVAPEQVQGPAAADRVPAHGDLNPWNLLYDGVAWTVLDWESVALLEPAFDMATLLEGVRGLGWPWPSDGDARALAAYAEHGGDAISPRAFAAALERFEWREWAWAVAQLRAGNRRDEIEAQRATYGRRLRARGHTLP